MTTPNLKLAAEAIALARSMIREGNPADAALALAEKALGTGKVRIMKIELRRGEGPTELCKGWETVKLRVGYTLLESASKTLGDWAYHCYETGYDKCDFRITFADGDTYSGRADIQKSHWARGGYDLADHILTHLLFTSGRQKPVHMAQDNFDGWHKSYLKDEDRAEAARILDGYDFH